MVEKLLVVMISLGLFTVYEFPRRNRLSGKARVIYFTIVGSSLYLGADYMLAAKLPHIDELLDLLFGGLERFIMNVLDHKNLT